MLFSTARISFGAVSVRYERVCTGGSVWCIAQHPAARPAEAEADKNMRNMVLFGHEKDEAAPVQRSLTESGACWPECTERLHRRSSWRVQWEYFCNGRRTHS
eukprot:IDg9129t1